VRLRTIKFFLRHRSFAPASNSLVQKFSHPLSRTKTRYLLGLP
jgi:hypothetical protein